MAVPKVQSVGANVEAYICPLCGSSFSITAHSLRCAQGHCFDIARSGSVNFAPQAKLAKHYDHSSFSERARVLESGMYNVIQEALLETLLDLKGHTWLDAGCGEGYFTRVLSAAHPAVYYAFDLSKQSIALAAKHRSPSVHYFVADLTRIPLRDHSMDGILNIFAPAHYAEFKRLLAEGGVLVKVVPSAQHLREVREIISAPQYSNDKVRTHLNRHFGEVQARSVSRSVELDPALRDALLTMTPLLQDIDLSLYDFSGLRRVTIGADILVARA